MTLPQRIIEFFQHHTNCIFTATQIHRYVVESDQWQQTPVFEIEDHLEALCKQHPQLHDLGSGSEPGSHSYMWSLSGST